MQDFWTAVSGLGFPVAIAGYILFRLEGKIERFTDVIEGKPSENKVGLIGVIQENTKFTKEANKRVEDFSKKMDKVITEIRKSNKK